MRQALWIAILLAAPTSALAQAGLALGSPADVTAPPPAEPAALGVDPEILALRAEQRGGRPVFTPMPNDSAYGSRPVAARPRPLSFGRSFGNAFGGFGIGAGVGYLAGIAAGAGLCSPDSLCIIVSGMVIGPIGAAILAPLGAGLGAWGFGEVAGGSGNALASVGGAYLGAGVGVGLAFGLMQLNPTFGVIFGPIVGALLTPLGAAIGYHVTGGAGDERAQAPDVVVVVPTIEAPQAGDGVVVGAAGAF